MPKMTWVDEQRLREEIQKMYPGTWLYRVLKQELKKKGYWKNLPRGSGGDKTAFYGGKLYDG